MSHSVLPGRCFLRRRLVLCMVRLAREVGLTAHPRKCTVRFLDAQPRKCVPVPLLVHPRKFPDAWFSLAGCDGAVIQHRVAVEGLQSAVFLALVITHEWLR